MTSSTWRPEVHVTVRGQHEPAACAAHGDVLRQELQVLEPGIERQCGVISRVDDVPRDDAPVDIAECPAREIEQVRGVPRRGPFDKQNLVCDLTGRELTVIESRVR